MLIILCIHVPLDDFKKKIDSGKCFENFLLHKDPLVDSFYVMMYDVREHQMKNYVTKKNIEKSYQIDWWTPHELNKSFLSSYDEQSLTIGQYLNFFVIKKIIIDQKGGASLVFQN